MISNWTGRGLLLDDRGASPHVAATNQIVDAKPYQIAASELAVDCKVKQGAVPKPFVLVQIKADCPNIPPP